MNKSDKIYIVCMSIVCMSVLLIVSLLPIQFGIFVILVKLFYKDVENICGEGE